MAFVFDKITIRAKVTHDLALNTVGAIYDGFPKSKENSILGRDAMICGYSMYTS